MSGRTKEQESEGREDYRMTVRMPVKLHEKFKRFAAFNAKDVGEVIVEAMEYWWKKQVPLDDRKFYGQGPPSRKAKKTQAEVQPKK